VQTLAQSLPSAEIGTAHTENTVTNTTTASLPTREESAAKAFDIIQYWMESGHSQLLSREQALEIAAWGLKIAGYSELQHQVLAELVELPEEALQPL
jgi:glutaredoxin 2